MVRTRSARHRRTGRSVGPTWLASAEEGACRRGTRPARRGRPWPAPCLPSASSTLVFFQEGSDLSQPAADTSQTLDGLLRFAGRTGRIGQEVVLQRALVLVE